MPRGSRPGERRGGRQRGTPNKKTLFKNAVFLAAASDLNRSPLEFMLALMRDPQVPLDERINLAAAAAPFVHARPEPVRKTAPDPLDLRDRLGHSGDLKFQRLDTKPVADRSGGENGGANGGPRPLDFLLGVMTDPAAIPRQRVKAAGVAARYKHPYAGGLEEPIVVVGADKFGFKVDPELARAERDDQLRESRLKMFKERSAEGLAAKPELEQIAKRRAERIALVNFPEGYRYGDRVADQKRLGQLYSKRLSRKKLTPEEEAEEAHLAVRVLHPQVDMLEGVRPIFSWQAEYEMKWPMTRMVELEERVLAGDTTAAEEDELRDLRSRHPEIAADVDRLDNEYNYWVRQETEKAKKAGLDGWGARQAAEQKCEQLRDPRKMLDLRDLREGPNPRIYFLETLRFDEKLTPEEADELEDLHRRYPERAGKTRKTVIQRLSEHQASRDCTRPIDEGGWPRMRAGPPRLAEA